MLFPNHVSFVLVCIFHFAGPYSERESARHVASLLSAINYMHDHAIVHRDLKFENIMFEDDRPDASIKVIDFGLSKKFLGQPGYMTERGT
jgi:calcium-dependent protein kinase